MSSADSNIYRRAQVDADEARPDARVSSDTPAKADDSSPIGRLNNALGEMLYPLDWVYEGWISENMPDGPKRRFAAEQQSEGYSQFQCDYASFLEALPTVALSEIVPPVGQTAIQYVTELRDLVERAKHLCMFAWTIPPDKEGPEDPRTPLLRDQMHELPAIRDALWEAWKHLRHAKEIEHFEESRRKPSETFTALTG